MEFASKCTISMLGFSPFRSCISASYYATRCKMVKPPSCEKLHCREGIEVADEDAKRLQCLPKHGRGNYATMPKKAGFKRSCGKNCRIWWNNQRTDLVHSSFSPEEEELIIKLHATIGSRWTIIAQQLPGRTDNEVKNFWNKNLKKKLTSIGIDPITHRPFSQILADYGNIGAFQKVQNHSGPSRDIRSEFMVKSEPPFSPPPESSSNFNSHSAARIPLPETERSKDHFNSNESASKNDNSLDLLSQLQAITMVTDTSKYSTRGTIPSRIPAECISSSASSSPPESPALATNNAIASSSFSWCDFLLADAFLPTNAREEEKEVKFSLNDVNKKEQQNAAAAEKQNHTSTKSIEASSVSSSSFVEAILERENEMLSDFHGLLEEPFYY